MEEKTIAAGIQAELQFVPAVNLALQQNALPVVYELKLANRTGRNLRDLDCVFHAVPEFIAPKRVHVAALDDGGELTLHQIGLELQYEILSALSDSLKGQLILEIKEGDELLARQEHPFTAFAADQWLGLGIMPELLASFVTPNLEVVSALMSTVAAELVKATGSPSIQGYQADKGRVYETCAAIYRAIHSLGIGYSNPPSSFGLPGQKIRFADAVCKYRLGTCLDTTLLFASVMEQCGLHPVLMLQKGHAYIGCHLVERYFADIPLDNLQAVRKLVDLDEFLVIETTAVTGDSTFSVAEAMARTGHLNIDGDFQCAIDVVRARYSGIQPLPLKRSTDGIELEPAAREKRALAPEFKRRLREELDLDSLDANRTQAGRIGRWQQKLLDLSLRNRLLNVRDTKQVITLACSDITLLEDRIAANQTLSLNPLSNLLGEKDLHDLAMLRGTDIKNDLRELLDRELGQRRLWTLLPPPELQRRLTGLYRQARTDLEEGGVNTLFLGIGFLEWKASERDSRSFLAPILLIPVRLQRKSMAEGILMSRLDEETIVNVTLLELLRREHNLAVPGLDPLPADDFGVDVNAVMQIFRQTVREMKGWEVREEARLGLFSFNKFIMWNDMTNRVESLKNHPLVRHLIDGGGLFDDNVEVFPQEEISKHLDLPRLFCPMSADSSQLAAVKYSELGKNFVLHGPPGTGKSQTITNIIAHNLALGRRVLFVSEKKAALDVVHRRLSSIGLRPFCLELHSSKAGKAEVLEQFAEALAVVDTPAPQSWPETVAELQKLRGELNDYVKKLHHAYPNGLSAYHCFSHQLNDPRRDAEGLITIDCLNHSLADRNAARQLMAETADAFAGTTPEASRALSLLEPRDWTPQFERELLGAAQTLKTDCEALLLSFREHAELFGMDAENHSLRHILHAAELAEAVKNCGDIPASFLSLQSENDIGFLLDFSRNALQLAAARETLANYRQEALSELDCDAIERRMAENRSKFMLFRFFADRRLLTELATLKKLGGGKLTIPELTGILPDVRRYNAARRAFDSQLERAGRLLESRYQGDGTDWQALTPVLEQAKLIYNRCAAAAGADHARLETMLGAMRTLLPSGRLRFADGSPGRRAVNLLLKRWNVFHEKQQAFASYAPTVPELSDAGSVIEAMRRILANADELRNVLIYRMRRAEVIAAGFPRLVDALEAGTVAPAGFPAFFESAYCSAMLQQILAASPVIANFVGASQNGRIDRFRMRDKQYIALSKGVVFARLAEKLPRRRSGPCPAGTELGLLKRECEKRARLKPVRQLLAEIPVLTATLKPCFLMSPLSVAQYLPPDSAPFDLIVFDEASQIPVWDAIGVVARGKQLIVVGDPKQMPPTNFFQKGDSEEADELPEAVTEDMESILDECIAAGVHCTYLNWHYRSRHESLISFSNHHYYGDRLFTFPAARDAETLGVRFRFVPGGVFDRRASRTNRREAEALTDYVFERLADPGLRGKSIGVVTFNQAQKDLIEDLVEQRRSRQPQFEAFFGDQAEEPFFVKNLENVQGDERDVILFSVAYAPDAEGRFSMNFGPLNRQGGERRLNVAITRAKEQVVVFASIHAPQIELARTGAVGAAHLKYFLDYAEKGAKVHSGSAPEAAEKAGVIRNIAAFLEANGFAVKPDVGCSGYRIDLAVVHPEKPDTYLVGIECDGPSYKCQRTVRDRDHLRHSVLQALGWKLHRAWSVDWTLDRKRAEAELLRVIEEARNAPQELPPPPPPPPVEPETVEKPPPRREHPRYRAWSGRVSLPQESFYEYRNRSVIGEQLREVIELEAPIRLGLLQKRIVKAWGFSRTSARIQGILNINLPNGCRTTEHGDEAVVWAPGADPGQYREFRVPEEGAERRAIDEIPPEELANAMLEVLTDFHSCEQDTLYRETARLFGLSSVTAKTRKYLDCAMKLLQSTDRI